VNRIASVYRSWQISRRNLQFWIANATIFDGYWQTLTLHARGAATVAEETLPAAASRRKGRRRRIAGNQPYAKLRLDEYCLRAEW
jgi:hypothetical protein